MKPQILPIIRPLFELVKGEMTRIVLLKNNTIVLLKDENDDYLTKLQMFSVTNPSQIITLNLHFYRSFNTTIYINPQMENVGLLYIENKNSTISKDELKEKVFQNFSQDLASPEVIFDSAINDIDEYEPIMYLFVNYGLKMGKGKIAAQCGHAVGIMVEELVNHPNQEFVDWKETSMKKVVLKADDEQTLLNLLKEKMEVTNLESGNCVQIRDAGCTQVPQNSLTVVGFKPMYKKDVPKEFSEYQLL